MIFGITKEVTLVVRTAQEFSYVLIPNLYITFCLEILPHQSPYNVCIQHIFYMLLYIYLQM